jgi:autotransporter adhesin
MPLDDTGDASKQLGQMKKDIERLGLHAGSGDSSHAGSGTDSVALGTGTTVASGYGAVAIGVGAEATDDAATVVGKDAHAEGTSSAAFGANAYATGLNSTALGYNSSASHSGSSAIGTGATTSASNQVKLGSAGDTVVVPGTFSNPSARHLKQNIIPAPSLTSIFPELVEYEYIDAVGRRRLGYIADDLMGTDAERFVTFNDDGAPNGIDYLSLLIAQVAQLSAELAALKNETKG